MLIFILFDMFDARLFFIRTLYMANSNDNYLTDKIMIWEEMGDFNKV